MKVTASIQARISSTRLPGKVLMDVCGKPMLHWQIQRLQQCRLVDSVVVATTTNPADDLISTFCSDRGIDCFRGSEVDVLGRIASLVRERKIDVHVECFGDSPLIDPQIVDEFVGYYLKYVDSIDYVSSALKTTYPPGMEAIVYSGNVLLMTDTAVVIDDPLREHAGYNITRFSNKFRLASLEAPSHYHFPNVHLEVDTIDDLEVMRAVVGFFVEQGIDYPSLSQILDLIRSSPQIFEKNANVERRWKILRDAYNP